MNDPSINAEERQIATSLVERVQDGSQAAETEMIERYSRGLRFLLRRRTRDSSLAEDFLQETWLIALAKIRREGLGEPDRLAGYLAGIARNLALGEIRRNVRQNTSANSELVDRIPDDSNNPYRQVSRAEICNHVRDLINALGTERDREILNRFYVYEEDKPTICERLGVDSTHFNRVLYRARQRLKSAIEASGRRSRFEVIN
jgi:RNA polymerase sigma-70 factor (ECF subfamily)